MAETEHPSWVREHAQILAVGMLFVVGLVVGVVGVTTAIGADDDLADAETGLEQVEQRLADLDSQADRVAARLVEAQATSATTLTEAERIATAGRELCDCDEEISALGAEALQAQLDRRLEEANRLFGEIDSWAEQSNLLLARILEAEGLPVPQVPVPEVPVPQVPVPEVPVPQIPVPEVPVPQIPVPEVPVPQIPVPEVPGP